MDSNPPKLVKSRQEDTTKISELSKATSTGVPKTLSLHRTPTARAASKAPTTPWLNKKLLKTPVATPVPIVYRAAFSVGVHCPR